MRGLRWPENEKFECFFSFVQQAARKEHAMFFLFAGEGRTFTTSNMEGEDLSGWLIPDEKATEFELQWQQNNSLAALQKWVDYFVWVVWRDKNGEILVKFERI